MAQNGDLRDARQGIHQAASAASINFITAHDGFTLHDLVSYNDEHNHENGENNADGENNNLSWNCGAEGPTTDPAILQLREQHKRSLMASLVLSLGVPMISGGDEMGRTQQGNNNAYGQDNELSWTHWDLTLAEQQFLAFTRRLVRFRRSQPVLMRRRFFQGRAIRGVTRLRSTRTSTRSISRRPTGARSGARCSTCSSSGSGTA